MNKASLDEAGAEEVGVMCEMMREKVIRSSLVALMVLLVGCANGGGMPDEELDLSRYRKVMVDPVVVAFDEDWQPVRTGSHIAMSAVEKDEIRDEIAALFDVAFRAGLAENGSLQLVNDAGPDVLHIRPQLADVHLNAPLDPAGLPTEIYVRSIGSLTLVARFHDSTSGEVLLTLQDRMRGRDTGMVRMASPVLTRAELKRMFKDWAEVIREDVFRAP